MANDLRAADTQREIVTVDYWLITMANDGSINGKSSIPVLMVSYEDGAKIEDKTVFVLVSDVQFMFAQQFGIWDLEDCENSNSHARKVKVRAVESSGDHPLRYSASSWVASWQEEAGRFRRFHEKKECLCTTKISKGFL